jgi:hypothetical protein
LRRSSIFGTTHAFCRTHFSRFIFTKCINRLHVSTSLETSLVFFFLTYSSPSFSSNRAPPELFNSLRRKNERNIHGALRRLLFFCMRTRKPTLSLLHCSSTSFFFLRLHRRRHFIFTQLHIHHANDQLLRVD